VKCEAEQLRSWIPFQRSSDPSGLWISESLSLEKLVGHSPCLRSLEVTGLNGEARKRAVIVQAQATAGLAVGSNPTLSANPGISGVSQSNRTTIWLYSDESLRGALYPSPRCINLGEGSTSRPRSRAFLRIGTFAYPHPARLNKLPRPSFFVSIQCGETALVGSREK
jgi:hypothetical protein